MGWVETHRRLSRGEPRGGERLLSALLVPPAALFGAGARLRNLAFDLRLASVHRLPPPWTVVSVGALAAGGTGKTPFAALLASRLRAEGTRPLLVAQGYGAPRREKRARLLFAGSGGHEPAETWETAGEEAVLLTRLAPEVPVAVAARFGDAAKVAAAVEEAPDLLVLDGGFQHRSLHADHRFVMIDASRPPSRARLLPRGDLREPWSALRRADRLVLHRAELCPDRGVWEAFLDRKAVGKERIWCENRLQAPVERTARGSGRVWTWTDLLGKRLGLWTGLGHPEAFLQGLETMGVRPVWSRFARDHAVLDPRGAEALARIARERRLDAILVTQKDAIKIGHLVDRLPPILVVPASIGPVEGDRDRLERWVREIAERHRGRGAAPARQDGAHAQNASLS